MNINWVEWGEKSEESEKRDKKISLRELEQGKLLSLDGYLIKR